MIEPTTAQMVINGILGWLTTYVTYKIGMKKAQEEGSAMPTKPQSQVLEQGGHALETIEAGVQAHGTPEDQTALAGYLQNPTMFQPVLSEALKKIALKSPEFGAHIQAIAQQSQIQLTGVHGEVHAHDSARIGMGIGVNTGDVTYNQGQSD